MIDANFFFKANTVFLPLNVVHRGKRNLTISSTELLLWKITTFRALTGTVYSYGPFWKPHVFWGVYRADSMAHNTQTEQQSRCPSFQ